MPSLLASSVQQLANRLDIQGGSRYDKLSPWHMQKALCICASCMQLICSAPSLQVFSWIFLCGGAPFICALVIQGLIVFNDETYVPERWHGTLLAWAYLLVPFTLNVYGRKLLKTIEIVGGIFYIIFFITTIVTLIVMAPRNPSEFVFKESFFGQSGWENEGVQWCLGLLTITAVLIGKTLSVIILSHLAKGHTELCR